MRDTCGAKFSSPFTNSGLWRYMIFCDIIQMINCEVLNVALKKKILRNFDFGLLFNVILICIIGIVIISSATHAFSGGSNRLFVQQIIWTVMGIALLVITAVIDYNVFKTYYKVIYAANILMLVAVILIGEVRNGANSWLGIGSFGIQPSEFIKISLIIVFARKIEEFEDGINKIKNLLILFAYAAIPLGLIMMQPDMGTAMVLIVIIIGMLFMAGLNLKVFIGGIAAGIAGIFAVFPFLDTYQQDRIKIFFNPQIDPSNRGYHILQSITAIGSGELFGMGYGKGIQNQGNYLPESETDFVFSVLGEEFGFIGAMVLILLYTMLIFKCIKIARQAKDKFGSMIGIGVVFMFIFQMFQNIGMTIGLMPITGITLPFVSYGGSSMWASMIAIGLLLNISMRRHKINF